MKKRTIVVIWFFATAALLCFFAVDELNQQHLFRKHLTVASVEKAYKKYSYYQERHLPFNQFIKIFPADNYSLYEVNNNFFYLNNKVDIIKGELRAGRAWEPQIQHVMSKLVKKGSNILDIGAHIGTHTVFLAKQLAATGTVWAFEPQSTIFLELNANLLANHLDNVKTLRYAVGDKLGTVQLSPVPKGNEGHTSIGSGGEVIDQVTIDSLHLKNVSLIKIDVETYEDQVLDGAINTIKENHPAIICEIMGGFVPNTPAIVDRIANTIAKFLSLGYTVIQLTPTDYLAIYHPNKYFLDSLTH